MYYIPDIILGIGCTAFNKTGLKSDTAPYNFYSLVLFAWLDSKKIITAYTLIAHNLVSVFKT